MAQYQINVDSNILFIGDSKDAGVAKLLESVLNQVLQAQGTEKLYAVMSEQRSARDIEMGHTRISSRHV